MKLFYATITAIILLILSISHASSIKTMDKLSASQALVIESMRVNNKALLELIEKMDNRIEKLEELFGVEY